MKLLGSLLRQFREAIGLTQLEISAHLNITNSNYSRMELGSVFPGIPIIHALNKKFKLSCDWLISNTGDMFDGGGKGNCIRINDRCEEELVDLFFHMSKLRFVYHLVIAFFLNYKAEHEETIKKELASLKDQGRGGRAFWLARLPFAMLNGIGKDRRAGGTVPGKKAKQDGEG